MSEEWFNQQLFPYGDQNAEDGCHPSEATALKDYLDHKTTPEQAAHAITQYTESYEKPHENLAVLWGFLQNALLQLSASELPRLIDLLHAIQQLPGLERAVKQTSGVIKFPWRSLPGFGHEWADSERPEWFKWREQVPDNDPSRSKLRAKHVRKAEIEARLVAGNIGGIGLDWGYECIVEALERTDAVLDFEIPAMAVWISFVGERLYAGGVYGEQSWALERGDLFGRDCGRTMKLDRWWFWEKRLQEILHHSQSSLDVQETTHDGEVVMRKAASEALKGMKACAKDFYGEEGLERLRQNSLIPKEEAS